MKRINNLNVKLVSLAIVLLTFASCKKYKKEIVELNQSRDSIQNIVDTRNDQILDYIISFNEIQQNLDSIKKIQKVLDVSMKQGIVENGKTEKNRILEDIALINNLLNQNKSMVASLKKKLKESNLKINELEQMIQSYVIQIQEKDQEIAALNGELGKLKIDISNLNQRINELSEESSQKSEVIEDQTNKMNEVYYCFGTKDELLENNVIEKTGGFLGIGKTVQIKPDFNLKYFSQVDKRTFSEIILMTKTAKILSLHPDSSYHFNTTDELVENLMIDQPDAFWETTKYLVILVEQ